MKLRFYHKKTCSTCRKARKLLEEIGADFEPIELADKLSVDELDALIGERDHRQFLNFRNELYRERKMRLNPPSRAEAIALMAEHPNLIKRPLTVAGDEIVLGFDEEKLRSLAAA
jgi:arsenate reductase (glutaredoxin)